ncbi:MAG: hypothetical protein NVSMB9_27260 [Isosphaeraceae bacterium]
MNPDVDEILTLDRLQDGPLASVNWATPGSGIQIRQGAEDLERLWAEHLRYVQPGPGEDDGVLEGDLRLALGRHRARERWLRDKKIAEVKRANNGRLPCQVCGFDFFEVYGEPGRGYAQVHHLKPLGNRVKPSLTKLTDLAVICANCHVMVHAGNEVRMLKSLLRKITKK